jgi:hypothetical protein
MLGMGRAHASNLMESKDEGLVASGATTLLGLTWQRVIQGVQTFDDETPAVVLLC